MGYMQEQSLNMVLREFIGNHAMPVKVVSELTGISTKQIAKHIDATCPNHPNWNDFWKYCELFPAFRRRVFAMQGYKVEKINPTKSCGFKMIEAMGPVLSDLGVMLKDGRIDDREAPVLLPKVTQMELTTVAFRAGLQ